MEHTAAARLKNIRVNPKICHFLICPPKYKNHCKNIEVNNILKSCFLFQVPTCCSCHIMGYSYVYPPLTHSASERNDQVSPLPTSPPAKYKPPASMIPELSLNPQKEFQSFLDNLGSKFSFSSRREAVAGSQDMQGRPSSNLPRLRVNPAQLKSRRPIRKNVVQRRNDDGKTKNFLQGWVRLLF